MEDYPAPADGTFRLTGHGNGHGIGMSQYGARNAAAPGRAPAPRSSTSTTPGTTTVTEPASSQLRVAADGRVETAVPVQGAAGLASGTWRPAGSRPWPIPPPAIGSCADPTALSVQSSADRRRWQASSSGAQPQGRRAVEYSRACRELRLYLPDGTSRGYQGTIAGVTLRDTTLVTVNTLEHRLRTSPECSGGRCRRRGRPRRCGCRRSRPGRSAASSGLRKPGVGSYWDLCDTTAVPGLRRPAALLGRDGDRPAAGVGAARRGADPRQVRTYAGAPIFAQFSASNGGWTVADTRFAYLPAKADPYDLTSNPYATWTASLSVARLASASRRRAPCSGSAC